ncbi:hypothetical protein AVEN_183169-1 [Araneus ventricosus]|uniref:Helitron helicase-like domain-containing protein n=1 Tax=Araneus ventricosus TaxID=182803 RepID=A0A4Y2IZL7_ARAVE|nr:hypothetical protein AVEN_183169-1 [Araneus ventricosus]
MAFVNSYGKLPFEKDIRVYPLNPENPQQPFININILSPNLDPYAILFPYGESGWQPNWRCESYQGEQGNQSRVNVTMLQYKSALTAVRDDSIQLLVWGNLWRTVLRHLTVMYISQYPPPDMGNSFCLVVEANNLNFARTHQQQLRTEFYQGLADHLENAAQNAVVKAGIPVIVPSSFEGTPRCADAIFIFAKYGAPDLFITFTANPKCPEITENFRPFEHTTDSPDLLARVFNVKLKSLTDDLTVENCLPLKCSLSLQNM